jgi:phosphatidylglycerophosphate synthase
MNIPNAISLFRILSILPVAILVSVNTLTSLYLALAIIIISYLSDGIDGYIARTYHQETTLGSILDILGDRTLEIGLWLIFASVGIVPSIVGIIFIIRGSITDTIRQINYGKNSSTPFSLSSSTFSKVIVSSRFSRLLYGVIKFATFCFAVYVLISRLNQSINFPIFLYYLQIMVWVTTIYNLVRGIPVIIESFGLLSNKRLV